MLNLNNLLTQVSNIQVEDRPIVKEIKTYIREHHPIEKEFVVETRPTGQAYIQLHLLALSQLKCVLSLWHNSLTLQPILVFGCDCADSWAGMLQGRSVSRCRPAPQRWWTPRSALWRSPLLTPVVESPLLSLVLEPLVPVV